VSCTAYVLDLFHPPARRKEENTGSGRQDRRMSGDGAREEEDGSERGRKSGQETSELGRELFGTPFFCCTKQDETKTVAAFTTPRCLSLFMRPYIHTRLIIVCGGLCWAVSIKFSLHFRVCLVYRLEPMFQAVRHQHLLTHPSPCPQNLQWQILTRVATYPRAAAFPNRLSSIAATGISDKYAAESVGPPRVMGWLLHVLRTTRHGMWVRCSGLC